MENFTETKIHFYHFNLEKPEQKAEWEDLYRMLKNTLGIKPFIYNGMVNTINRKTVIYENKTEIIRLNTEFIFDNQWNGDCDSLKNHRVFDWLLYEFVNKNIKCGHWIEPTFDIMDLRSQYKCRYCGHIVGYDPGDGFHHKCLGSEYLEEEELYMATYGRIYDMWPKGEKNKKVPENILLEHRQKKKDFWEKRLKEANDNALAKAKKDMENAKFKYEAYKFLNENGFTDFDNLIYYDHKKTFCFGWRDGHRYSKDKAKILRKLLEDIGFESFGKFEIMEY